MADLPKRSLGGLRVSALGLGCMGMSEFYGAAEDATSLEVLAGRAGYGDRLF